jgi:hypothetical protein
MKIATRTLPPPLRPAMDITLTGDELVGAILAYLAARNLSVIGPLAINVDGERLRGVAHVVIQLDPESNIVITE